MPLRFPGQQFGLSDRIKPMKYINVTRDNRNSDYTLVEPTVSGQLLHFGAQSVEPKLGGVAVPMTKVNVRVDVPTTTTSCGVECPVPVNESIAISLNVLRGGESITALRAEVDRCLDIALAQYSLAYGIVPPATADFQSE